MTPLLLVVACATPAAVGIAAAPAAAAPPKIQFALLHTRFGSRGLFGRRPSYGYGYNGYRSRYYRRPSLLHRVTRALAIAYILHLLFTNGLFSLLVWALIISLFVRLFRRRRVRRYSYQ